MRYMMKSRIARGLRGPLGYCLVGARLAGVLPACGRRDAKASKEAQTPIPTLLVAQVPQRTVSVGADFVARTQAVPPGENRARISRVLEQVRFREGSEVKE